MTLHAVTPPEWAWGHRHRWETEPHGESHADEWFWLCIECGTTLPRYWDSNEMPHATHYADVHGKAPHFCDCFDGT